MRRAGLGWLGFGLLSAGVVGFLAFGLERGRTRTAARSAHPQTVGTLEMPGATAPIRVLRDRHGVPHIYAANESDAWLALGFVHAQDRLAQMLWLVRLARGRTAEIEGEAGLARDRLARTLDLGGRAEREWESAPSEMKALLGAYARGVNRRIERVRAGAVAPPIALVRSGIPLEDWRPADSLAVQKLHAWNLSGGIDVGLFLDDLLEHLGGVEARPFFPDADAPPFAPGSGAAASVGPVDLRADPLRRAGALHGVSAGSNAWVVGGGSSRSGRPLLVADLHVAPTAPVLFHVVHLRAGERDLVGAMVPGVPLPWTGHNGRIAWASTRARVAATDLYQERVGPGGAEYHDGRRWRALIERVERIGVRGGEEIVHRVRSTRHGPLLDGLLGAGSEPLAVAWVGFRGAGARTLASFARAARAEDAAAFVAALEGASAPPLDVAYADARGSAGVQLVGWIPQRPLATQLIPVPGRAPWYDWDQRIPFASLPRARLSGQPATGWVIAADNSAPDGEPPAEWLWRPGVVAARIDDELRAAARPLDLEQMLSLQRDVRDARGARLTRLALELVEIDELEQEAHEVAELLREWDGASSEESAGAAAHHAFRISLVRALFREPLGDALLSRWLALPQAEPVEVLHRVLAAAAANRPIADWADRTRVAAAVRGALREAWFELSSRLGGSRRKWRWGRLHSMTFQPFVPGGEAGPVLEPLELPGSSGTIATTGYDAHDPFEVRIAPLFRFAVDTARFDDARFALAPGASEHPGHPNFGDGLESWQGAGFALPLAPERLGPVSELELVPSAEVGP